MAQVEFHTLDGNGGDAWLRLACALVERGFQAGQRVLVWLEDGPMQQAFDQLLWTFDDHAFVPHEALADDPATCEAPVQLTCADTLDGPLQQHFHVLVNLRGNASETALGFARVVEVVDGQPARREAARARYRFYRDHGAPPQHIKVA